MSNQNYSATISVDQSPKEAFEAIRNVRGWWSEEIEGSTAKVGDEFRYHYQNLHTCTMKLVELVPDKRVAWLVTDNYECFNVCSDAWGRYIRGSLKSLIATGKGSPNQKESVETV